MSESKSKALLDELLQIAGSAPASADVKNPADVERYLSDLMRTVDGKISEILDGGAPVGEDGYPESMSDAAKAWMTAVATANNDQKMLAEVGISDDGLSLEDLASEQSAPAAPAKTEPSESQSDESGDAPAADDVAAKPEPAKAASSGRKRLAFSPKNPWARETKTAATVQSVVKSEGTTALDLESLSADTGQATTSAKQVVVITLAAFEVMSAAGWIDTDNPAVSNFISNIEGNSHE